MYREVSKNLCVFYSKKKKYEKFGKCYLRSFESFYAVTNKSIFEINYTKI